MDDSDAEYVEPMEPSPDDEGEIAAPHGYDALFFLIATALAVGFAAALWFLRG